MCGSCGCQADSSADHNHHHHHHHDADHHHGHDHHHARGETESVRLDREVLGKNSAQAAKNRTEFVSRGLFVINLLSSPGSGKTSLLENLCRHFGESMAVIEGDIATTRDADRILAAGARATQIQTNGACHLDAVAVHHALESLPTEGCRLLVIENVGNLVCPAAYDLGEHEKWAVLSVPEGDDKVLKYPALFSRIHSLIINKVDLLEYVDFDTERVIRECRSINAGFDLFRVSARNHTGINDLIAHLEKKIHGSVDR